MDKKIISSLLFTVGIVFITLTIMNMIFQSLFGEVGIYVSMFTSIIFTLIYCTQLVHVKLDKNIDN